MTSRAAVCYPFPNLLELGWGNSLRASLLIRYLAEQCERVDTVSPARQAGEAIDGVVRHRQVASSAWRQHADRWQLRFARLVAGTESAFARSVLARFDEPRTIRGFDGALRAAVSDADAVFVEYPFWMPYIAPVCREYGVPVILSLYDVHAHAHAAEPAVASQIASRELDAIRLADVVFCASDDDREYLTAHGIESRLAINPIDVASCRAADAASATALRARHRLGDAPIAMFVGSRIVPNMEAAQAITRIAPMVPDCTFVIAGRCVRPGREGNVVRLGWLSAEELEALYAAAELVVMPLSSGTGTSLKFVEAMAYAKPIVATTVAARGYDARHGDHAHIAPRVDDVAAGVRRVLDEPAYRERLAAGARSLAPRYDFRVVFEPYGALLRQGRAQPPAGVP